MAQAPQPYQAQVRPGGSAPLPMADIGAATAPGRALASFGAEVGREIDAAQAVKRNEALLAGQVALERVKQDVETQQVAWEAGENDSVAPGWLGYKDMAVGYWDERARRVIDGIEDKQVRARLEAAALDYRGGLAEKTGRFEAGKRLAKIGTDWAELGDLRANRARFSTKPAEWADALEEVERDAAAANVAPDVRDKMVADGKDKIARGVIEGLLDRGQTQEARALIERGGEVGLPPLDPDWVGVKLREAGVIDRRIEAEAEAKARLAKADAKEEVDGVVRQLRDGIPQTRETIARVAELVKTHDLKSEGYDLAKLTTQADVVKETQPMLPAQISAELAKVEAKIAAAGDRAKPADIWRRDALRDQLGNRRAAIESDPYQFGAQNGVKIVPVDFADPASIAARIRAQGALSQATGRPVPFFTRDEADQLAAKARGGPQNRMEAVEALARIPGPRRLAAAEQISPKDAAFAQATTLTAPLRQEHFEGEQLRQGNAQLTGGPIGTEIRARWAEANAPALRELGAQYQNGVLAVATNLYAYRSSRRGLDDFDEALWDDAVNDAIDPSGKGGIGEWKGRRFKLPAGMSQGEFEHRWSRAPHIGGVYWQDGSAIPTATIKDRFAPVAAPVAGQYWLVDRRGNYARNKAGGRAVISLGAAK